MARKPATVATPPVPAWLPTPDEEAQRFFGYSREGSSLPYSPEELALVVDDPLTTLHRALVDTELDFSTFDQQVTIKGWPWRIIRASIIELRIRSVDPEVMREVNQAQLELEGAKARIAAVNDRLPKELRR